MARSFPSDSKSSNSDLFLTIGLIVLVIAGLGGGWSLYHTTRDFVATSQLPIFPRPESNAQALPTPESMVNQTPLPTATENAVVVVESTGTATTATPVTATAEPVLAGLDEPLTILLMGIDLRPLEEDIPRTDSMILVRYDPVTGGIGMMSFPRDLYVTMPNYGDGEYLDRINMPYRLGELHDYPGGGPALAKQTIRRNFGIEVDRYMTMDFNGFRRMIDEIGGIEIDVPREIVDYSYPTEDFGTMTIRFEEGVQTMDGERALIYARTRHSSSDIDRAERQQQVILAVRSKVLSLDILPSLTPNRIANLAATVNESVATDLSVDEVFGLAQALQGVKTQDISRAVIDSSMTVDYITYGGAQVLLPRWQLILPSVEEIFGVELLPIAATPTPPPPRPTATPTPVYVADYSGSIFVQNASSFDGVEATIQGQLSSEGFITVGSGVALTRGQAYSSIIVGNPDAYPTALTLARRFGFGNNGIQQSGSGGADITFVIGDDLAASFYNPIAPNTEGGTDAPTSDPATNGNMPIIDPAILNPVAPAP